MAALIRHASNATLRNNLPIIRQSVTGGTTANRRHFAAAKKTTNTTTTYGPTLESARESLASRGYLRPHKDYSPANDVVKRLDEICKNEGVETLNETRLDQPIIRFKLLAACSKEFNHSVPNSLLHTVETLADLRKFYLTPVNTTMPLDAMKDQNLPENLHIRYQYHRFNPETDTMFGGKTAFPKSSTLVTGLKYKKKYPGHTVKSSWP